MIMQKTALESLFLIDIETVSEKESFHLLEPEWQELWSEKINRSLPAEVTAEEYYHMRAAILSEFAKVVCISFGYFKKVPGASPSNALQLRIKSLCSENEEELLKGFVEALRHFH